MRIARPKAAMVLKRFVSLLFGKLPTKAELDTFTHILNTSRNFDSFTEDVILKWPTKHYEQAGQMYTFMLFYEENPDDMSVDKVLSVASTLLPRCRYLLLILIWQNAITLTI